MAAADFRVEPWDHGASRIDAIAALERVVRVAQARIVEQVDSLYRDRLTHDLPGATDHRLWVAAEVAMARNVSPTAGRSSFQLSMGLRLMPHARRAFGDGVISEPTVRAIVREFELVPEDTMRLVDDGLAEHLPGLTPKRAANSSGSCWSPTTRSRPRSAHGRRGPTSAPHSRGGPTTQANGQAVCQLTNQVKELPGWSVRGDARGAVTWTTPTGHTCTSPPPRPHRRT